MTFFLLKSGWQNNFYYVILHGCELEELGGEVLSFSKIYAEVSYKVKCLADEVSRTEWHDTAVIIEEENADLENYFAWLRKRFWCSNKIGTKVLRYADPHLREEKFHEEDGEIKYKEEYTELYDPVQACWREVESEICFNTRPYWFKPKLLIHEAFESNLLFGMLAYRWAVSVSKENEAVAIKAMQVASGLLDKCTGMVWVKTFWEKEKKLSRKRANAGKEGGRGKAEAYKAIQEQLAKMLHEKGVKSGWKSKTAAVDDILEDLWSFVQAPEFTIKSSSNQHRVATMSQEALRDTIIKQWSTKVDIVKEAFDATVTRKKKGNK